jgi:GH25 family lysozyme M1 (1,4-beta-N-acetylmuramidase)
VTCYGPDVSSYQPSTGWAAVRTTGNEFGISKATQGTGYTNPSFAHDMAGLRAIGMVRGAYHFATPRDHPGASGAAAEAAHYASVVAAQGGLADRQAFRPILDLEGTYVSGIGAATVSAWAIAWFAEANRRLGTHGGIVYANYYDARDQMNGSQLAPAGHQLWLAAYTTSIPSTPPGWPSYPIQQYTNHARIPGVTSPCDRSVVRGDQAALLSTTATPSPATQHWSVPVTVTDPVTHESITLNSHVDVWFPLAKGQQDFAETVAVQYWLDRNGNALRLDGVFGDATEQAVRNYQAAHGLVIDGVAGPVAAVRLGITTP